jgi:HlyD family secretion protein
LRPWRPTRTDARPGLFATALIQQPCQQALLVPATAVETVAGTSRAYAVKNEKIEERIVTVGESVGQQVEISSGVTKDDSLAVAPKGHLSDGLEVRARRISR